MRVLPNTAGCHTVKEAVTTAEMAREVFDTPWVKLEVISDDDTLAPDLIGLVEAARILARDGFQVFPYTTEDLGIAEKLVDAGCKILMPWGAPIGSGRGLNNPYGLRAMRARVSLTCRLSSMPASVRPRMRPRQWSSVTTRSCSTRQSPKQATRS